MTTRRSNVLPRLLSLVMACGGLAVAGLILVLPAYSTASTAVSSDGSTTSSTGSETVLAANPQAAPLLIGVVLVGLLIAVAGVLTAWTHAAPARWILAVLLVPTSAVAILSLPSIGIFLLPFAAIGWTVVVTAQPRGDSPDRAGPPAQRGC